MSTKEKRNPRSLRCFVSAPFGFNVDVAVRTLTEAGVKTLQADKLKPGELLSESVIKEVLAADFVCVVLPDDKNSANQMFELGAAIGAGIPAVILLEPQVQLPSDLLGMSYARVSLGKPETVRIAIHGFLRSLNRTQNRFREAPKRGNAKINRSRALAEFETLSKSGGNARAHALEQFIQSLFEKAGIPVVSEPGKGDRGVDLAIWLDDVDHSIGNPILVEIKSGRMPSGRWRGAVEQLRAYLAQTGSHCGLIISGGVLPPESSPVLPSMPLVMAFSAYDLINLLAEENLSSEIIRRRNLAVHGKVS